MKETDKCLWVTTTTVPFIFPTVLIISKPTKRVNNPPANERQEQQAGIPVIRKGKTIIIRNPVFSTGKY
jgi:hypothetical protein